MVKFDAYIQQQKDYFYVGKDFVWVICVILGRVVGVF